MTVKQMGVPKVANRRLPHHSGFGRIAGKLGLTPLSGVLRFFFLDGMLDTGAPFHERFNRKITRTRFPGRILEEGGLIMLAAA